MGSGRGQHVWMRPAETIDPTQQSLSKISASEEEKEGARLPARSPHSVGASSHLHCSLRAWTLITSSTGGMAP